MATAKEKLTALADAVREKTGESKPLSLDTMTALIQALEVGDGIPEGWAMGTFTTTADTAEGDFYIEHGLGKIPNVIIIFAETEEMVGGTVMGVIRLNNGEEFGGDRYYPLYSVGRTICAKSSTSGIDFVQLGDSGSQEDSRTAIFVADRSGYVYYPSFTYRWVAIRFGGAV